ncbi:MAG: CvpA family protein [Chloroflexi bacterium]|nr:CvpA family protein [Chloroflexota bacterium]
MIQLSNMLWLCALFAAVLGYQRGWNRELITLAAIVLGWYTLFQFDALIRGTLLAMMPADQVFLVEAGIFCVFVFYVYQTRLLAPQQEGRGSSETRRERTQNGILGAVVGFANGYLIWGTLWYLLDINEYPLSPWVVAPAPGSASSQAIGALPIVFFGGGVDGTGDFLTAIVIVVLFIVLVVM